MLLQVSGLFLLGDSMKYAALDCETTGPDLFHGCRPFAVSFAYLDGEDMKGKIWEWDVNPMTREPSIPPREIASLRQYIADYNLVFHNMKFDIRALEVAGIIEWKYTGKLPNGKLKGVTVPELLQRSDDTLTASHIVNSLESHSLKDLALAYTDILPDDQELLKECVMEAKKDARRWKWDIAVDKHRHWPAISIKSGDSAKKTNGSEEKAGWQFDMWVPRQVAITKKLPTDHVWRTVLRQYALRDVQRTLSLWLAATLPGWDTYGYRNWIESSGYKEQYEVRKRQLWITYRMERNGLPIDKKTALETLAVFEKQKETAINRIQNISRRLGVEIENPNSDKQMRDVIFGPLGMKPSKATKTGLASLDKDAMDILIEQTKPETQQHILLASHKQMKQSDVCRRYLQTYLDGGIDAGNGMIILNPSIITTGTKTTRFAGEDPNPQNIGKKDAPSGFYIWHKGCIRWVNAAKVELPDGKERKEYRLLNGNVLDIVPQPYNNRVVFRPLPGWVLYDIDYDNGEMRLFAYDCGDPRLIEAFRTGGSLHLVICRELWGDMLPSDDGEAKKTDMYRWTKAGNFSLIYGAGEPKADATYHIPGAYRKLRSRFEHIDRFIDRMHQSVTQYGKVDTLGGPKSYPLGVSRYEPHKAANYRVQGSLGLIANHAMCYCDDYLYEINDGDPDEPIGRNLLQVHDSLIFAFREDSDHETHARECARLMSQAAADILAATPGIDMSILPTVPIPTSIDQIKAGMSWAKGKGLSL